KCHTGKVFIFMMQEHIFLMTPWKRRKMCISKLFILIYRGREFKKLMLYLLAMSIWTITEAFPSFNKISQFITSLQANTMDGRKKSEQHGKMYIQLSSMKC